MTTCAVNSTLPTASVSYIDNKCTVTSELPRFSLAPDPVTGYPLYSSKSGTGFHLVIPCAATNHIRNPVFANDLETWSGVNVAPTRTNQWSFEAGSSLRLRGTGDTSDPLALRAYMETEVFGFIPGVSFVVSGYGWQKEIFDNQDPLMGTISLVQLDDTDTEISELVSQPLSKIARWQRIALTTTLASNTARVLIRLNLRSQTKRRLYSPFDEILNDNGDPIQNSKDEYLFWDMIQFEQGTEPTTPFHGETSYCDDPGKGDCGNYSWEAYPHQSASYRSECARDGGKLVSLTDLGFEILSHSGHDGMPVTNLAQPYSNKPGSNYQKSILGPSRTLTFTSYTCGCSLSDLECNTFNLKDLIMPEIGGCSGKLLLVYRHDADDCKDNCDEDRDLAMCVVYAGGFEYTRDNLFQQRIVLQFEAHDPLAWFSYPGSRSIALNFVEAIPGNKVIKLEQEGGYQTFPIDTNTDIRTIACLPGTNEFFIGGDFDQINATDTGQNALIYSCNESCSLQGGGFNGVINVAKHTQVGHVILGGAFTGNLAIIYADNQAQGGFTDYPGGEVWAIEKPFWAIIAAGTDSAIYIQKEDSTWLTFATNGRVRDLQQDGLGNLYATGDFTTIDGVSFQRVARFNVNIGGCLDVNNGVWESIGYGFDDTMNSITLDPDTNSLYFGGLANNAIPDSVDICNDTIGRSTDSKGKGFGCSYVYETLALFIVTAGNTLTLNTSDSTGGSQLCNMEFFISTDGAFVASTGGFDNPEVTGLVPNDEVLNFHFPYPVTNLTLEFVNVNAGEGFSAFSTLPSSQTGYTIINGNFYRADGTDPSTLTWDGPLTDLTFDYFVFDALNADGEFEWQRVHFEVDSTGNNQQFSFENIAVGQTRFEVSLSNTIAQAFLFDCLNDTLTALQKRYVRITSTNSQGIAYNFLIGDDNLLSNSQFTEGGMYVVRMDVNTLATFPEPCASLNVPFTNEFDQSNEDLELFKTLILTGGLGVDNILSSITIQCLTLDVTFQGDNVPLNHVACLNGQNLTGLGDGFTTEVYKVLFNPDSKEIWAGYDGGLRVWNGQDWFEFPGNLSGSVIDMDNCPQSCDIYLLTDEDGAHVMPGITDINYFGDFEQLASNLQIHGPALFESMLEHCANKQARFCAQVECGETAKLNIGTANFQGSRDFNSTVLSGSRLDFWLRKCGQRFSLYITNDSATTRATLIFREHFWGIDAICCAGKGDGVNGGGLLALPDDSIGDCCHNEFSQHRDPNSDDCFNEGWLAGDQWLNINTLCGSPRLFVNTGQGCDDICSIGGLRAGDQTLTIDGEAICIT